MRRAIICLALYGSLAATGVGAQHRGPCPDYDHDHVVSVADVQAIGEHFGRYAGGPPGYEGRFDLNHDRRIDLSDILITVSHLGESCQEGR